MGSLPFFGKGFGLFDLFGSHLTGDVWEYVFGIFFQTSSPI